MCSLSNSLIWGTETILGIEANSRWPNRKDPYEKKWETVQYAILDVDAVERTRSRFLADNAGKIVRQFSCDA